MLPIRDNVPTRTFPFVNLGIIGLNGWFFFQELAQGKNLEKFVYQYGLVPAKYAVPGLLAKIGLKHYLTPFLTSMFLHGGWMHILSNMWMLYIFGDNIEDSIGHLRYLLFYLLCGIVAGVTQLWAAWGSPFPTIGASGAIAGVMGAFFILFPFARVVCVFPMFIFFPTAEVPAAIFLGLWLWSQIYSGSLALSGAGHLAGVAWWAHIGGFVGGILLLGFFLSGRRGRSRR